MSKHEKSTPTTLIIIGLLGIVASGLFLHQLQELETNGGTMSINIVFYFLYEAFGKEVSAGILFLLGLIFLVSGILKISNNKKWEKFEKENNKPRFITIDNEEFLVTKKLNETEANFLDALELEIKEGKLYKHFWKEGINQNEQDENWLNRTKYFWKAEESFLNTALPEEFENYQQLTFRVLDIDLRIVTENLNQKAERYHAEKDHKVIFIPELKQQNQIEYCQIEEIDEDTLGDLKYYKDDLFLLITNPKVKLQNDVLFVGSEPISFVTAHSFGALELVRTTKSKITADAVS